MSVKLNATNFTFPKNNITEKTFHVTTFESRLLASSPDVFTRFESLKVLLERPSL